MLELVKKQKSKLQLVKNSAGFTIVETLVIVAIIVFFSSIVVFNFSTARSQFALSRAAHAFAKNIRRAQDMALSSVSYKDSGGVVWQVSGYGVYINMDSLGDKHYLIYADSALSGSGNEQYDASDYVVENIDINSNEKEVFIKEIIHATGNTLSINFSISNLATTITESSQDDVLVVFAAESNPEKTRSVLVNTAGLVEVQ